MILIRAAIPRLKNIMIELSKVALALVDIIVGVGLITITLANVPIPVAVVLSLVAALIALIIGIFDAVMSSKRYQAKYDINKPYHDQIIKNLTEVLGKTKDPRVHKKAKDCIRKLKYFVGRIDNFDARNLDLL